MAQLIDIFNDLQAQGLIDSDVDYSEFENAMNTDADYNQKVMQAASKPKEPMAQQRPQSPMERVQEEEQPQPVKKKEPSELSSATGSSVSSNEPPFKPSTALPSDVLRQRPQVNEFERQKIEKKVVDDKRRFAEKQAQEARDLKARQIEDAQMAQELAKQQKQVSRDIFEDPKFQKELFKNKFEFLNEQLSNVSEELISRNEEYIVPELNYRFGPLGFKFEEAEPGFNYIKVIAPNKKQMTIGVSNSGIIESNKENAKRLQDFIKNNALQIPNLQRFESNYKDEFKKYKDKQEIEKDMEIIRLREKDYEARAENFVKKKQELDNEKEVIGRLYRENNYSYTPELEKQLEAFYKKQDKLVQEQNSLMNYYNNRESNIKQINSSIGQYLDMKSQQGTWWGGIKTEFNKFFVEQVPKFFAREAAKLVGREDTYGFDGTNIENSKRILEIARNNGIEIPFSPSQYNGSKEQVEEYNKWAQKNPDAIYGISKQLADERTKQLYYGDKNELTGIREGGQKDKIEKYAAEFMDPNITVEYHQLKQKEFWYGAVTGLANSIPSIALGTLTGGAGMIAGMSLQTMTMLDDEMSRNKEFQDIPEEEKNLILVPLAITTSVLEYFGFRNAIANKGVLNGIVMRALGKAGTGTTATSFAELVKYEVKSAAARGALTMAGAAAAEAETGFMQEGADIGIKKIYNTIKGKEMFKTPSTWGEVATQMIRAGAQEAVGGLIMGVLPGFAAAYRKQGFEGMSDEQFLLYEAAANDTKIEDMFKTKLQSQVNNGEITREQADETLEDYRNSVGLFNELTDGLSVEDKKKAMNLLREKRGLNEKIAGKDDALKVPLQNRVNEINKELTKLSENAIQKQTTGQVPVQPTPGNSQAVEEGVPQSKVELTPEQKDANEKRKTELETALANAEEGATDIIVGETTMPIQEAKDELNSLTKTVVETKPTPEEIKTQSDQLQTQLAGTTFDGVGEFARTLGNSTQDAVPIRLQQNEKSNTVEYVNPETGEVDVIASAVDDNNFVAFYRLYENGQPTNQWSSKFQTEESSKGLFKEMFVQAQAKLPKGYNWTEKESISTDGLRVWAQQLERGHSVVVDENGTPKTRRVWINAGSRNNILGIPVTEQQRQNMDKIMANTSAKIESAKKALIPLMQSLGLNENNIHFENGMISIDLPILRNSATQTQEAVQPEVGQVSNAPIELHKMNDFSQVESRAKNETQKKIVRQAVKALKSLQSIIPNIEIILHDNNESYFNATGKKSRGEFQYNDAGVRRIHINLNRANILTVGHEVGHAVLLHAFGDNPILMEKFKSKIGKLLLEQKGGETILKNGKKYSLKEYLEEFVNNPEYKNEDKAEEYLAELSGLMSGIGVKLDQSILQKIAALVNTIVSKATGGKIKVFEDIKDTKQVIDFFNSMAQSLKAGTEIKVDKKAAAIKKAGTKSQLPSKPKVATFFSGAGTMEAALPNAESVMAVEFNPQYVEAYNNAFGMKYDAKDVTTVTPQEVKDANPDIFHASPVCKNFSAAKRARTVEKSDMESAQSVARVIKEATPPVVTIENVPQYQGTVPFNTIVKALEEAGYTYDIGVYNAADYGGVQNRKRLLIRAVKDGQLPALPKKQKAGDWYAAVKDLIKDAPKSSFEGKKGGQNWEIGRINEMVKQGKLDPTKPIITMGGTAFKDGAAAANAGGPAPTLRSTSKETPRILMPNGDVVKVTPEMMRRLMGLPDTYVIPSNPKVAKEVLGNGMDGNFTKALIEPLVGGEMKSKSQLTDDKTVTNGLKKLDDKSINNLRSVLPNFNRNEVTINGQKFTKDEIKNLIKDKIGGDVDKIVDIYITGSMVYGTSTKNSDIDVVVEYKGDIREDSLFDIANDDPIELNGVKLDINPIKEEKSGTIADQIEKEKKYFNEVADAKYLSKAYAKAKQDGSNPELVKAVDEAIGMKSKSQMPSVNEVSKALEGVSEREMETKILPNITNVYKIQDDGAEVILERKFVPNRLWVYKIENAGDIIRELSKYKNTFLDPSYIYEKVNKIEKFLKEQQNQSLVHTDDSYLEFKRQNEKNVNDFISEYESLPTMSEAQDVAKKMVLDLLNGNIEEVQKGIDYFNDIRKADDIRDELYKKNKYRIAEAYVQAKKDGSNPELVKAVDDVIEMKSKSSIGAFTGSPYNFDKFSTEKIGTGEGNQAFGWGLYFSDLKDIARGYAQMGDRILSFNENEILSDLLYKYENDFEKTKKEILEKSKDPENVYHISLNNKIKNGYKPSRNVYQVTLHKGKTPDQYTYLDWYEPVSDKDRQKIADLALKEGVNIAYEKNGKALLNASDEITGEELYKELTKSFVLGSPKEASLFLLRAGIDGIKYPAESIAKGKTSETARGFNYVVFDDNAITIEMKSKSQFSADELNELNGIDPNFNDSFDNLIDGVEQEVEAGNQISMKRTDIIKAVEDFVLRSPLFKKIAQVNSVLSEKIMREAKKAVGIALKSAPSFNKLFNINPGVTIIKDKDAISAQISLLNRGGKDMKKNLNEGKAIILAAIKPLVRKGKISTKQAVAIINRFGRVNLLSDVSINRFVDYMDKVFNDANYAETLVKTKSMMKTLKALAADKKRNPELRAFASEVLKINPSLLEGNDFRLFNKYMLPGLIDALKGTTDKQAFENSFVDVPNITKDGSGVTGWVNQKLQEQEKIKQDELAEKERKLFDDLTARGENVTGMTYKEMKELKKRLDAQGQATTFDEAVALRNAVDQFNNNKAIIEQMLSSGYDADGDPITFTEGQRRIIEEFMGIDISSFSLKNATKAVDALEHFIKNQSIASLEAIVKANIGVNNSKRVVANKIKATVLQYLKSDLLGRLFGEYLTPMPMFFERLFAGQKTGAFVMKMMGLTDMVNGKARATKMANDVSINYVKQFYKRKANGQAFNTKFNTIERGMAAFVRRNIIGTAEEMDKEFQRRKSLIEQSIDALRNGDEKEQQLAEVYREVYNKILLNSNNASDVSNSVDDTNLDAISYWEDVWDSKFEKMAELSSGVYNEILEKGIRYTPDRFKKLTAYDDSKGIRVVGPNGEIINIDGKELTDTDRQTYYNTGQFYNKKTGTMMKAVRPQRLPSNPDGKEVARYIDLSFDSNNANSFYDSMVNLETAGSVIQTQAFLDSEEFKQIVPTQEERDIFTKMVKLYQRNARNRNIYGEDDSLTGVAKKINALTKLGITAALAGLATPIKQTLPIIGNTFMNTFNPLRPTQTVHFVENIFSALKSMTGLRSDKIDFVNNSGRTIANRGLESVTQIESLNRLMDQAATSKTEALGKFISKANEKILKVALANFDVAVAKASWLAYYEKYLIDNGYKIPFRGIDYKNHRMDEDAADYADQQVNRQQNTSDADLRGKLYTQNQSPVAILGKNMILPFASFRINQSSRLFNDLRVFSKWNLSSSEDRWAAFRSLIGFATEMALFRIISLYVADMLSDVALGLRGKDDDEEDEEKKAKRLEKNLKSAATNVVTDVFSPFPLADPLIQQGAYAIIDKMQEEMEIPVDQRMNLYEGMQKTITNSIGVPGVAVDRLATLLEVIKLAADGEFKDKKTKETKWISELDQNNLRDMIFPSALTVFGLLPTEFNTVTKNMIKQAQIDGTTIQGGETAADIANKFNEEQRKAEKEEKTEGTKDQQIEALTILFNNTGDKEKQQVIMDMISELTATKEEKKARSEAVESMKLDEEREYQELLAGYATKSDLERYDPATYEQNFGENSDYYKKNYYKVTVQKEKNAIIKAIKDKKNDWVPKKRGRKKRKWD